MKKFFYNTLISKEDLADRKEDIENLVNFVRKNKKISLYAPRRYGKSSLVYSILPEELKAYKIVSLYVDFMGCQTQESITQRLLTSFSKCLSENYKIDSIKNLTKTYIKNLAISYGSDPLTGQVSLDLKSLPQSKNQLVDVLNSIVQFAEDKSNSSKHLFLAFDEFQDIAEIPEAISLFRSCLQKLKSTSVIFLGSKRKLLSKIFSSQQSPFFNFADEYVLKPVPFNDWIPFFNERLHPIKTKVKASALTYICEESLFVPNTICEVGAFIQDYYPHQVIDEDNIKFIFSDLIKNKSENFKFQLAQLTINEIKFCKSLALNSFTKNITGHQFISHSGLGASTALKICNKLYKLGLVEEETFGYRLSNPLMSLYLKYFQF